MSSLGKPGEGKKEEASGGWNASVCNAGMLLAAGAIGRILPGMFGDPGVVTTFSIIAFGAIFGAGCGLFLIRLSCLEAWTKPGWAPWEIFCAASLGLGMAILSYWCGMRQFGGFDHSALIDMGWRLYSGQKPYVDFPCTLPVGFYLGAEWAFRWFGVFWSSIIKFNVFYLLLTYFWLFIVLRQVFHNRYLALLMVIACESMSMLLDSYWWYNPVTNITVVIYAASAAALLLRPERIPMWISLCLSLLLVALLKPNVSGVAIIGGTSALLLKPETRWKAGAVSLVAFLLWLGVLAVHGLSMMQVVKSYLSVASRGATSENFLKDSLFFEKVLAWVCVGALLPAWVRGAWLQRPLPKTFPLVVLAAFSLLSSLYGFYTNAEPKLVDLPLGLLASALILGSENQKDKGLCVAPGWVSYLILICSIFTFASVCEAVTRTRVRMIGLGAFFEYRMEDKAIDHGFFQGMRGGHNFHVAVDRIEKVCSRGPVENIFFGPRLEWAYAAFHIPSPKGLPVWWDKGVSFAAADEDLYTARWIAHRFNPVILVYSTNLDSRLVEHLRTSYSLERGYAKNPDAGSVLILRAKR